MKKILSITLLAFLTSFFAISVSGQNVSATWGANANTAWYTTTNWVGGSFAGIKAVATSNANIATFTSAFTGTTPGINMGTSSLSLGAISIDNTRTTALNIGNSSATGGTLTLYGATVNSVANVIVRNNGTGLLTLQAAQSGTMGIVLSNATANIINIDGTGGVTISSIISGANPLTLGGAGTGKLTLSGVNTYTGATTISSGTMFVNGSLASGSAATVSSGGTLGGSGTVNGTLAISGTVSPGATGTPSIGNLSSGAQTWSAGAAYTMDISALSGTAGTNWDLLTSSGAVTLPASGNVTVNLTSTASGFVNTSSYTWKFVTGTSIANFNAANFTVNASGFTGATGTFSVTKPNATELDIVYTPAATPSLTANALASVSLTGFSTTSGVASASQSFTLAGVNLTGTNIVLTAPTGYEVSTNNTTFSNSVTLISGTTATYTSPTLSNTTIYIRINNSASLGSVSGSLTISGGGASTPPTVSMSGFVVAAAPTTQATNVTISSITSSTFDVSWTNGNGGNRVVVVSPSSASAVSPSNGTDYTSTANLNITSASTTGTSNYVVYAGTGSGIITVAGLSGATTYNVQVYEYNGITTTTNYLTTSATQNPNSATTLAPIYYWNGGTPTAGSGVTAAGGTGTWTTANSWVQPTNPGTGSSWLSNNIASFGSTAGVVTTPNATTTASNSIFNVTGYNLISGGTSQQLTSPISLNGSNVDLGMNQNNTNQFFLSGSITSSLGVTGSNTMTLSGTGFSTANNTSILAMVGASSSVSVPVIINMGSAVNSNVIGIVTRATGVTVPGSITLNGTIGSARALLGGTSGNSMTCSGLISGTGDIHFSSGLTGGAATLSLSNTGNNFNGNLYMVSAASGKFQASAGVGTCVPSTMGLYYATASNGGIFDINGSNVTLATLSQTAAGATGGITNGGGSSAVLTVNQSGSTSFGPLVISNGVSPLGFTLAGGTLTLTGTHTYTGATSVTGGNLFVNGSTASGSAVSVSSGATLGGNGTTAGTVSLSGTITPGSAAATVGAINTGAFTFNANSTYKFEVSNGGLAAGTGYDEIVSSGAITCSASPITIDITSLTGITFNATSTYAWTIASGTSISGFSAGNFTLQTTNFAPLLAGGSFNVSQVGNTIVLNFVPVVPSLTPTPSTLTGFTYAQGFGPSTAQSFTVSGTNLTPGPGVITIAGSTDFEVSTTSATTGFGPVATLSYTGTSSVSPNTVWVRLSSGLAAASYTGELISIYGGGVLVGTPATVTVSGTVTGIYYWNGGTPTAGSGVTANGGTGIWTTANAWVQPGNPGTGATWANNNVAYFAGTAGIVTLSSAITATSSNFTVNNYTLTQSAANTLTSPIILSSGVNLNLMPNITSTFTLAGNISGASGSGITFNGTTLTGSQSFRMSMSTASSSISVPITFTTHPTLSTSLIGLVATGLGVTISGPITLNGTVGGQKSGLCATSGNSLTLNGQITGTGDIQYSTSLSGGAGPLTFANTTNNFTGNIYMAGATSGFVKASSGAGTCIPSTTGVYWSTSGAGGNFDLNGSNVTIAALSSSTGAVGGLTNNGSASTLTVNQSINTSYGLVISNGSSTNTLGLTKTGAGSLTLTAANTYTTATNINGGSLIINATSGLAVASAVSVGSAGTLGGNGSVLGTVSLTGSVSPGAAVSPSVGNLTTGAETWNSGATYKFDMTAATGTAGTNWDLLTSTGSIDVSAGSYTVDITGNPTGFSNTTPYSWTIATAASITGFSASNFTLSTTNFTASFTGTFSLIQSGNSLVLEYTPALQGSLIGNGPFCASTATAQLTWVATDGVGPYTLVYNDGTANRTATAVTSGTAFNAFTNPITTNTTYTLVSVTDNTTGTIRTSGFTTSTATITISPAATVVINTPATVCSPATVDLTAAAVTAGSSAGLSYTYWTNSAATIAYSTPTTSTTGTYYIKGTSPGGCYDIQPVTVTVSPTPSATASNTGPYIPGQTINLTAGPSGQTSYTWSGPAAFSASGQNVSRTSSTAAMSGTYTVTVSNGAGCSSTATTSVAVNGLGDYTWTGATNTNWATVTNWTPTAPVGGPSGCSQNVIIPVVTNYPVISSATSIARATINSGAQLTLNANLSICQNYTGGTTSAAIVTGTGHLVMAGTGAQTMSGLCNVDYLEINHTSTSLVSTATFNINKAMIMTKGAFSNNGSITLVSNASGDAYLDNFSSPTAGSMSNILSVQRYISNTADGYRDFSSPVATSVNDLNNAFPVFGQDNVDCWYAYSPYPNVQVFKEPLIIATGNFYEHWLSYTSLTKPLTAMTGYSARTYKGTPFTITFKGSIYNGAKSMPITHTTSSTPSADGWNLLGNPYPSPIQWSLVKAMNAAVANGSYYVYHTTDEYTGNWGSYNGTTGVNGATDLIAIGQGFFIQTATSGTFTMNNTVRTAGSGSFYRTRALDNEIRLTLSKGVNSDEIVTYTESGATAGFDADLDAQKIAAGSAVSIGYSLSGRDYAINAMDVITEQTVLPLTISGKETGSYTLTATTINVPGLTAYLLDSKTGSLTDLSTSASVQLSLTGGQTYAGRYSVVFQSNSASTGITATEASKTRIYAYGNQVHVVRSSANPATISVTNLLGQEIKEIPTNTEKTVFELPAVQPWYAIIKVTEGDKTTVSKVIISNN